MARKNNGRKGKFPKDYPVREESREKYNKFESKQGMNCFSGKANDPMWYAQNPSLLRDAASFPYGWPVGNRLTLDAGAIIDAGSIPGVMAFYVSPAIGQATTENSPVNMAMRNVYAYVRHANSGHTNYDAPDLMLYLLAMDSVYSYHSFLKRVYGLARAYTPINRYYPKAVLTAMGVDYEDVMSHLAQLRYGINALQAKFSAMRIPNSMSYMARHMWMYTNIYQDGDTDKCQTYFYTPHAFFQFAYDEDGAGKLHYLPFMTGNSGSNLKTVDDLIDFGNSLINPILASEDMGIMSGDILKAFGDGNLVTLTPVDTNYLVLPEYNTEVLSQMENLSMIGYPTSESADITQAGVDPTTGLQHAFLTNNPKFQHPATVGGANPSFRDEAFSDLWIPNTMRRIINFHKDAVEAADTMVATRLANILQPIPIGEGSNLTTFTATCSTLGSEYVNAGAIFYYAGNDASWALRSSGYFFTNVTAQRFGTLSFVGTSGATASQLADAYAASEASFAAVTRESAQLELLLARLSIFDWHPMVVPVHVQSAILIDVTDDNPSVVTRVDSDYDQETSLPTGFFMDVENYTTMVTHDLERLSEAALLSEFQVPAMGSAQRKI